MSYAHKSEGFPTAGGPLITAKPGLQYLDCSLAQLRSRVVTNAHRRDMWSKLISFLALPILSGKFSLLYVNGGFVTAKEFPGDIDIILQTREPYGPAAFRALEPFFAIGLETILETFTVHLHFWMHGAPSGVVDFRSFFSHARRGHFHSALPADRRLYRISLERPAILEDLRRELEVVSQPANWRFPQSR
jgi:hypothetical protein